jgi:hypothetical protein
MLEVFHAVKEAFDIEIGRTIGSLKVNLFSSFPPSAALKRESFLSSAVRLSFPTSFYKASFPHWITSNLKLEAVFSSETLVPIY